MIEEGIDIAIALETCCDSPSKLLSVQLEALVVGMSELTVGANDELQVVFGCDSGVQACNLLVL